MIGQVYVCVLVEGQTEKSFVYNILQKAMPWPFVFEARPVLTSRDKKGGENRGGITSYTKVRNDLMKWMKQDKRQQRIFTTMIDYYALPTSFPGMQTVHTLPNPMAKVRHLQREMEADIGDDRFFAYLQLHEFEALFFTDLKVLKSEYLENQKAINHLAKEVANLAPELINDGPNTAPSKRLESAIPRYNKVAAVSAVLPKIGLPRLRECCPHFNAWIKRIEQHRP